MTNTLAYVAAFPINMRLVISDYKGQMHFLRVITWLQKFEAIVNDKHTRICTSLERKYMTRVNVNVTDKHSSFLRYGIKYSQKV